jgi:hypothetical protein
MTKWANDLFMDASLNYLKTNVTRVSVCKNQPTTVAQAHTTYALSSTVLATGDFTLADGTSGRKVTVAQKASVAVASTGTATHIALYVSGGTPLCYVTTCATQVLTSGNTVTLPAWEVQVGDPS